jgi:DNA-3-methyladenine glycosylase
MQQNRKSPDPTQLTNGPAKLTQALGIDKLANNTYVNMDEISLEPGFVPEHIVHTTRVGIKQAIDHPWRFYVAANPHVSRLAKA